MLRPHIGSVHDGLRSVCEDFVNSIYIGQRTFICYDSTYESLYIEVFLEARIQVRLRGNAHFFLSSDGALNVAGSIRDIGRY
jgi:hypothetical protein